MSASRYFSPRYWASKYWAKVGGEPVDTPYASLLLNTPISNRSVQVTTAIQEKTAQLTTWIQP